MEIILLIFVIILIILGLTASIMCGILVANDPNIYVIIGLITGIIISLFGGLLLFYFIKKLQCNKINGSFYGTTCYLK